MQNRRNSSSFFQNYQISHNNTTTMLKGVISTVRAPERYLNNYNNNNGVGGGGGHAINPPLMIKCNNNNHNRPMHEMYGSDEFRMYAYKIKPCPRTRSHDWTQCPYAHRNEKAQRRDPCRFNYSAVACPAFRDGRNCPNGDACGYAHGVFEYWLHPARYRTRECNAGKYCQRKVCFFAHSPEQLRPEFESDKTVRRYAWRMRMRMRMRVDVDVDVLKESKVADDETTVVHDSINRATTREDDDGDDFDDHKQILSEFLRNKLSIRGGGDNNQETDAPDYLPNLAWISDLLD